MKKIPSYNQLDGGASCVQKVTNMKQRILITIVALLALSSAIGQNFEKVVFNAKEEDDYYIQLKPGAERIQGVLVLMPGYGEKAESIFPSSNLFNTAYANGILTIAITGGEKLYADETVIDKLNRALTYFIQRNPGVARDQFVMGGFSAGGTISFRYAEYSVEHPTKSPIALKGVFAVDSPVDLGDIWEYFQREIKKNYSEVGVFEAKMVSEQMKREIGTPESNPKRYNELTPFNYKLCPRSVLSPHRHIHYNTVTVLPLLILHDIKFLLI